MRMTIDGANYPFVSRVTIAKRRDVPPNTIVMVKRCMKMKMPTDVIDSR